MDVPVANADLGELEQRYLSEALASGFLSGAGPFVKRFEQAFAERVQTRYAIACANGTVSLHLALAALAVGAGDEVIVPDLTYVATANAVSYCGARPVFADVEPDTWCLSRRTVEPLLNSSTVGIIPVHLYGQPCDVEGLRELADEHGLFMVEDAAQAHGATLRGRPVGSFGEVSSFSFYGNKILTSGEGGMACTNNVALATRMRSLAGHCMDPKRRYWHTDVGHNYRMANLCAAVGLAQVERLDALLASRRQIDTWYRAALASTEQIQLPAQRDFAEDVCWLFSVVLRNGADGRREHVLAKLTEAGIDARPFFASLSELPFHVAQAAHYSVPTTSRQLAASGLSLPTGPHVVPHVVERVCEVLLRALG